MNNPKVDLQASQSFTPYPHADLDAEFVGAEELVSVEEMKALIRDRMAVDFPFSGQVSVGTISGIPYNLTGFRAMGYNANNDPDWRWMSFITGFSGGMSGGTNNWEYRDDAAARGITPGNATWGNYEYSRILPESCLRKWYEWGVRRFALHSPFGRNHRGIHGQTAGSSSTFIAGLTALGLTWTAEPLVYDIDAFLNTRDGLVVNGRTACRAMPWLTDDVVDGKVQGFVPLFRALITGSSAGLPQDVWENLTGIGGPSAWYDPNDPIEVTAYCGALHQETYERWKTLAETNPQAFRSRLEESYRPFIRAGMRIGLDACPNSPGATVGINAQMSDAEKTIGSGWFNSRNQQQTTTTSFANPTWRNSVTRSSDNLGYQLNLPASGVYAPPRDANGLPIGTLGSTFGNALDAGWWDFFQNWLIPQAGGKNNLFIEAIPRTFKVNGVTFNNPYLGHPVISGEEYAQAGFVDSLERHHYNREHGPVEFRRYLFGGNPLIAVGVSASNGIAVNRFDATFGFTYDKYWFLQPFAAPDNNFAAPVGGNFPVSSSGSLAEPARSGIVYDYIRPGRVTGYNGESQWGPYWLAEGLLNKPSQRNDPSTLSEDRTKPITVLTAQALRPLPSTSIGAYTPLTKFQELFGITNDFVRRFPTIDSYAQYLAFLKKGGSKDPRYDFESTITETVFGTTGERTLAVDMRGKARTLARSKNMSPIVFLTFEEYDRHSGTKLSGLSGGAFYEPSLAFDVAEEKLRSYLEYKYLEHHHRYGVYPEKFVWEFSERNDEVNSFQLMRYLLKPLNLPFTAEDNAISFSNREGRGYYDEKPPVVSIVNEIPFFRNNEGVDGYSISIFAELPDRLYGKAKNIALKILKVTKDWSVAKGGPAVGLYSFPWLPLYGSHVYGITAGSQQDDNGVLVHRNRWEDPVWKVAAPQTVFSTTSNGTDVYEPDTLTEADTADMKARVFLEFRKRQEPLLQYLDFAFPQIADYSNKNMVGDYDYLHTQKTRHEQILALAEQMTQIERISYIFGFDSLPAWTGGVMPTVSYHHVGDAEAGISHGDPKSKMFGSLPDHDQVNHELIDWIRDDWLRPAFRRNPRIRGMAIRNDALDFVGSAGKSASDTPTLTAREQVLKWLYTQDGLGATVDWGNTADALSKTRQFVQTHYDLTLQYLNRFNRGIPRIDVVKPYDWTPFAAGWGQTAGDAYPTEIEGVAITDVVPLIYASDANVRRAPGDTAGMDSTRFNNFITRYNNAGVPAGRRVLLPHYFGFTEPPGTQRTFEDYYKQTSDGVTYDGLYQLDHETLPVRLPSVFGYQSSQDLRDGIKAFFNQCKAQGILFDYIANDYEYQGRYSVGGFESNFSGPFGPTGMPAELSGSNVVVLQSYKSVPDPRIQYATINDPRFTGLTIEYTGKSFADTLVQKYEQISSVVDNLSTISNLTFTKAGMTAGEIMEYYYLEGPTGISAATGPAWVSDYGNPQPTGSARTALQSASPFPNPFGARSGQNNVQSYLTRASGGIRVVNNYITWLAQADTMADLIFGDLVKTSWKYSIHGTTLDEYRGVKYSNYRHTPIGLTEGSLLRDYNNHPYLYNFGDYGENMYGYSPVLYGELSDTLRIGRYYPNPTTDKQRYTIQSSSTTSNTVEFGSGRPENLTTAPRSYIGFLKELVLLRGLLRNRPDAWTRMFPWVTGPYTQNFESGWRYDQTTGTRPTDPRYGKEMVYHTLLHGAEVLNYFNSQTSATDPSLTFHQNIKWMQQLLNEWKTQSEGKRVQPCSNALGDVDSPADRIIMSEAGANHATYDENGKMIGGQGVVVSGARILDPDDVGTTGTYLWRVTVAPQVSRLVRVEEGYTADLPQFIELNQFDNDVDRGVWIKRTATSEMPKYHREETQVLSLPLPPALDAADYAVFASMWTGMDYITPPDTAFLRIFPTGTYGTPSWGYTACVPQVIDAAVYTLVNPSENYGTTHVLGYSSVNFNNPEFITYVPSGQNTETESANRNTTNFNSHRRPDDFTTEGIRDSDISTLKTRLELSPPGRRVYRSYFHFYEYSPQNRDRLYYDVFKPVTFPFDSNDGVNDFVIDLEPLVQSNPNIGAGIGYTYDTPSGVTQAIIAGPFGGAGINRSVHSVRKLIERHAVAGVSFDWYVLDEEAQFYWFLVSYSSNSYNSWGRGICGDVNSPNFGYPSDRYFTWAPNVGSGTRDERPFRPAMPDARVASAIVKSSLSDTSPHPQTGRTFGAEFVKNYQEVSGDMSVNFSNWKSFLAPLVGVTGPTAFGPNLSEVWTEYSNPSNNGLVGLDRMTNGWTFAHYAIPAFNAAVETFYWGGAKYVIYNQSLNRHLSTNSGSLSDESSFIPGPYAGVKVCHYDISPIEPSQVLFSSQSNAEKHMQRIMPHTLNAPPIQCSMGSMSYAKFGMNKILTRFLYPSEIKGISFAAGNKGGVFDFEHLRDGVSAAFPFSGNSVSYDTEWGKRTGYVRNPQDPREEYVWQGQFYTTYGGPAGNSNLVRYPLDSVKPYNTAGTNLVLDTTKIPDFYNQLCFKDLIQTMKELRIRHASDHTLWERWNDWISDPQWADSDFSMGTNRPRSPFELHAEVARCYWYETVYHEILHGVEHFQHWTDRPQQAGIAHLNAALHEWRRISRNSRARPLNPYTGEIPSAENPMPKLPLWEAFDKVLISGGKLLNTDLKGFGTDEVYIWRITVAPHHFVNNSVTLRRTNDADDDIPNFIFINRFNFNGTENVLNGRGVWIVRLNNPSPPQYEIG